MKKSKILLLIVCLCVITLSFYFKAEQVRVNALECSAKSMYLMEMNSSRQLYAKNAEQKLPMASTTKIVTAITVLENYKGDLDTRLAVPDCAVGIEGTSMYLRKGEKLSIRELLYGLMLPSANDAATALAVLTSGSEKEFCDLMKTTARKAGACDSNFVNAHGLDCEGHYTTAKDLSLITAYAMKNDTFMELSKAKSYVVPATEQTDVRYLTNKNKLLKMRDDCIGVKIGFTDNAGRCIVSAIEKDGMVFICTLLNCPSMFVESDNLFNKVCTEYKRVDLLQPYKYLTSLSVENGKTNFTRVFSENGFSCPLTDEEKENIKIKYKYEENLTAPISKNQKVGDVEIYLYNCLIFKTKICTMDNVEKQSKAESLKDILDRLL